MSFVVSSMSSHLKTQTDHPPMYFPFSYLQFFKGKYAIISSVKINLKNNEHVTGIKTKLGGARL